MERLNEQQLRLEQQKTLSTPRMTYGLLARLLFTAMDLLYGRKRTLSKFKVLEVIARVPYQSWEHLAFIAITQTHAFPDFARRVVDRVKESRLQQDNEQWHLFLLEELVARKAVREGFIRYRLISQFIAFVYYHVSWLLYVIRPSSRYMMSAHFRRSRRARVHGVCRREPSSDRSATMSECTNRKPGAHRIRALFVNVHSAISRQQSAFPLCQYE